jgi:hypothetical protein
VITFYFDAYCSVFKTPAEGKSGALALKGCSITASCSSRDGELAAGRDRRLPTIGQNG